MEGGGLYRIWVVCHSLHSSVCLSIRHNFFVWWGGEGGLYRIWVVCHSLHSSVCSSIRHNFFVSAQYLQNFFIKFIKILYMYWYWHDLAWYCYTSFFPNLYQSYVPLFTPKFRFRSISWELLDIFSQNLYMQWYWQDLAWDILLLVIFLKLVPELWPFIYSVIWFLINILRTIW